MDTTAGTFDRVAPLRLTGMLAMAGGICYLASALVLEQASSADHAGANLLGTFWTIGSIAGLVGIGIRGLAGHGLLGRIALAIATLSLALLALGNMLVIGDVLSAEESALFGISRLGLIVGMLLLGIATVAARRWTGWRRFAPFAPHVAIPSATLLYYVANIEYPIVLTMGLAWVLIGYAIWSTPGE